MENLDNINELIRQASELLEELDFFEQSDFVSIPIFQLFENTLRKFNYFYALNYYEYELNYDNYNFLSTILDFTERVPETEFLYRIATCVDTHMKLSLNPVRCILNKYLIDDFIIFFRKYCPIVRQLFDPTYFLAIKLENFEKLLDKFIGEWRNNEFQINLENNIPPEYYWYREGEE